LCAIIAGGAAWFVLLRDDSGYGGVLGSPVILLMAGIVFFRGLAVDAPQATSVRPPAAPLTCPSRAFRGRG
jgi:hypothetical protein